MAYGYKRRRNFRPYKRRYRKSTPWYKKKYSAAEMAGKALSGLNYMRKMLNVEKKLLDTSISVGMDDAGSITHLTGIAQGNDITNRSGNSVKGVYLGLRLSSTANTAAKQTYRIMVIKDNQQLTDTAPSIADVLDTTTPTSFLAPGILGRFSVLYDKIYSVQNDGAQGGKNHKIDLNLNHHVRYNGATANDIQKGGLYLILLSDDVASSTYTSMVGNVRFRYVDN